MPRVPEAVLQLKHLSKLSMACCNLTSLPAELANLTTLRYDAQRMHGNVTAQRVVGRPWLSRTRLSARLLCTFVRICS